VKPVLGENKSTGSVGDGTETFGEVVGDGVVVMGMEILFWPNIKHNYLQGLHTFLFLLMASFDDTTLVCPITIPQQTVTTVPLSPKP